MWRRGRVFFGVRCLGAWRSRRALASPFLPLAFPFLIQLLLAALSGLLPAYGGKRRVDATLYEFEKTSRLVSSGVFRYIRHPMYASLLALTWAVFCQDPSWPGLALAGLATALLVRTTLADEAECLAYFGEEYRRYMQRTRRYLPFLL